MKENLQEYINFQIQKIIPLLISIFFVLLSHVHLPFEVPIRPMLGFCCVFFWLFNRPDIFNLFSVSIIGILCDVLNYTPFGLYLFMFVLMYVLETKIEKYIGNKFFIVNFVSFAIISLFVLLAGWLLVSIYYKSFTPFITDFFAWIITVCLYPLVAAINIKISSRLLSAEDFG